MSFDPHRWLDSLPTFYSTGAQSGKVRAYCRLCNTSCKDPQHCHDKEHTHVERSRQIQEIHQAERDFAKRRRRVSGLQLRISKLGCRAWRDGVEIPLFQYLMKVDKKSSFHVASRRLKKYEYMERVSLLELAVWKHVCQTARPLDYANEVI